MSVKENPDRKTNYNNRQGSEYAKVLNVSDAIHSVRSLYKLLRSDRGRSVFRAVSNI